MTDAPEKIWVHYEVETDEAMWSEYPDTDGIEDFLHYGEYTRSDIAQARIDKLERALKDCSAVNRMTFKRADNFYSMMSAVDDVVTAALKEDE